jgi:hypothetical protein
VTRRRVDLLTTVALVALHTTLHHVLAGRDLVESLLSPSAGSSLPALALGVVFLLSRIATLVVLPAYWCFRALTRLLEPRDTAPDRHPGPAAVASDGDQRL